MTPAPPPDRELRPSLAAAGAGLLVAVTWSVWSGSGSRLSLFVCIATLAVAAIDVAWAIVATKRVRVTVTGNPPEAIVGDTVAVELAVEGPRQFLHVSVRSFAPAPTAVGIEVPTAGPVAGVVTAREVLTDLVVEVVSHGLAGLVACARRLPVRLARPLAVGPRPIPAAEPLPELLRAWGEGEARPDPSGDLVRGVRPYVAGDPQRRVHWRATARVGDLVVKEVEDPGAARLVIVLDLGAGGISAERAAGRAAWYAGEGIRRGYTVVLATAELARHGARARARPVTGPVTSPSSVIRRLAAAAAPGTPDVPTDAPPGSILFVTDKGDSWR